MSVPWHAALFVAAVLSAPSGTRAASVALIERTRQEMRVPKTLPLAIAATVGDVVVAAWDRDEISIEFERSADSATDFAKVFESVALSDALTVSATQRGGQKAARLRATIRLFVPPAQPIRSIDVFEGRVRLQGLGGGVRATVVRGDIDARAMAGRLRLETTIGDVRLEYAAGETNGPIRLRAFNGSVNLRFLGPPRSMRLLALTLNGAVSSNLPLTQRSGTGPRFAEATFGAGEPVVSIDVVNGDITIASPP
jgi:hypothetical protein